jgi:ankyrin repeat protein
MKTNLTIFLLLFISLLPVKSQTLQKDSITDIFPGISVILPVETTMKLKWILSPSDPATVNKTTNNKNNLLFTVDKDGQPWIGHSDQMIFNPQKGYQIKLSHTFNDFVHLDNGALFFSTPTELGIAAPTKKSKVDQNNLPIFEFQPVTSLPYHDSRMYRGTDNCLYFTGRNPATGENEVFVINFRKSTDAIDRVSSSGANVETQGIASLLFGQFHKVFSTEEQITAVAGDGTNTWLALGNLVIKVSDKGNQISKVFSHPDQDIRQLIYVKNTGLVYSTGTKVGYIGQKGNIEFLTAPLHSIASQNGNLYLLFHESLGVISIENISGLKKMDIAFNSIVSKSSKDVQITNVQFFEYGPPDYSGNAYAERFDRSTTRYLSCQIDLENLSINNPNSHSVTTTWLTSAGEVLHSNTVLVSFSEGEKSKPTFLTMGTDKAGSFFPGQYIVKIYIDASYASEKRFNVFGEVNCFDAIRYHDINLLKELLPTLPDANQKDASGCPLLHYAIIKGSVEDVSLVLKAGANINILNESGETALFLAGWPSIHDGMAKALLLIKSGINIDAKERHGKTAFFNSALPEWNREFVTLLLQNGANINSVGASGKTVLSTLISDADIWGNHSDIVDFLLANGAHMNVDPVSSDFINLLQGDPNPDYVRLFIKSGAKINQTGVDERNHAEKLSGLLNSALLTYLSYLKTDDRPNLQKALEVVNILLNEGAKLLTAEENIILNPDILKILDADFITSILDKNSDLMIKVAGMNDQRVQFHCVDKLLESVKKKITESSSNNDLSDALKLGNEVRKITERAGDQSWPEVYLYCGLAEEHLGENEPGETDLRKYISMIPAESRNLDEIKSLIKDLARKNKKKK